PIDWDSKELELDGGKIDCIWNGMTITEARIEAMFIPKAYVANAQIVIVPAGSAIKTVADLEGKTVGLQKGSSALEALQSDAVYEKVGSVTEYEDNVTCYLDLKAGRVDAMVVDEIVGRYLIETE
ncbi:MAG: transporter substrate-binding domain-containing protein, partial [Clostridia bacterium]|nr:transporter substrate-binding domain-containing protein [Clostridia bacterium]